MAQSQYQPPTSSSTGSDLKDKATEQFGKMAAQVEGVASTVAEHGREVGEHVQAVAGNIKGAVDRSVKDQPMATLAIAATVGFVLGALGSRNAAAQPATNEGAGHVPRLNQQREVRRWRGGC